MGAVLAVSLLSLLLGLLLPQTYASRSVVVVTSTNVGLDMRLAYYGQVLLAGTMNPYVAYFDDLARQRFDGGREIVPRNAQLQATAVLGQRSIALDVVGRSDDPRAASAAAARSAAAFARFVPQAGPKNRAGRPFLRARVTESARPATSPSGAVPVFVAVVGGICALVAGVAVPLAAERLAAGRRRSRDTPSGQAPACPR